MIDSSWMFSSRKPPRKSARSHSVALEPRFQAQISRVASFFDLRMPAGSVVPSSRGKTASPRPFCVAPVMEKFEERPPTVGLSRKLESTPRSACSYQPPLESASETDSETARV